MQSACMDSHPPSLGGGRAEGREAGEHPLSRHPRPVGGVAFSKLDQQGDRMLRGACLPPVVAAADAFIAS